MDFFIEVSKTGVMSDVAKILLSGLVSIGGAIGGVILGFYLSQRSMSRQERNRLEGIKMLLSDEMITNYQLLITYTPLKGQEHLVLEDIDSPLLATAQTFLSCRVYESYLGYICGFRKNEIQAISGAYRSIMAGKTIAENVLANKGGGDSAFKQTFCDNLITAAELTLYLIEEAVLLIDAERETLDDLKELRGHRYQ